MVIFVKTADEVRGGRIIEVRARREDATRGRLRTKAPNGEDLVIDLPRAQAISDGDIFGPSPEGAYYRISIEPETVMRVSLNRSGPEKDLENAIKLGLSLGNRHLEVLVEGDAVYVPLIIGEEEIREILRRTGLPLKAELVQKVISARAAGYFAGEEEEG